MNADYPANGVTFARRSTDRDFVSGFTRGEDLLSILPLLPAEFDPNAVADFVALEIKVVNASPRLQVLFDPTGTGTFTGAKAAILEGDFGAPTVQDLVADGTLLL